MSTWYWGKKPSHNSGRSSKSLRVFSLMKHESQTLVDFSSSFQPGCALERILTSAITDNESCSDQEMLIHLQH